MTQKSDVVTRSSLLSSTADGDNAIANAFARAIEADDQLRAASASTVTQAPAPAAAAKPARVAKPAPIKAKAAAKAKAPAKPAPTVTKVPEGMTGRDARAARFANPATGGNTSTQTPITFEVVKARCPSPGVVAKIVAAFPDIDGIDDADLYAATRTALAMMDKALPLNEKAKEIHLERVTRAYLLSALGACDFFQKKSSECREHFTRMSNEAGDGDRDGVAGFQDKGDRMREFAAGLAVQAFALTTVAMAAVDSYEEITGNKYRPYTRNNTNTAAVSKAVAKAQMAALAG